MRKRNRYRKGMRENRRQNENKKERMRKREREGRRERECLDRKNKKFFMMRVVKHWNRLPREVLDAPPLQTFKVSLDGALSNLI
ncbi:hypothetical protein QYF61_024361 [Mycteria americana]|uniref:Uncharacterized protein n=1 Tax=Mycteria americana TaxID=33587 RepID=A0AAN7RRM0_MYCAM|nr:hypothetical protein QYF61_024361 [Mycteria americana]